MDGGVRLVTTHRVAKNWARMSAHTHTQSTLITILVTFFFPLRFSCLKEYSILTSQNISSSVCLISFPTILSQCSLLSLCFLFPRHQLPPIYHNNNVRNKLQVHSLANLLILRINLPKLT